MKKFTCYVCGNPDIVTTLPVPVCVWHDTPPQMGPDDDDWTPSEEEFEVEEYYSDDRLFGEFGIPVYPV